MQRFCTFAAATSLSAAMLLTGAAQAMEIQKYDEMASADKDEYVAELAIGAEKVLRDEGKTDLADRVHKLFTEIKPGDEIPIGVGEFEINLTLARVADAKRTEKNPAARRLEVEDAMIVTLRKNNIELPANFLTVNSGFQPKFPLK